MVALPTLMSLDEDDGALIERSEREPEVFATLYDGHAPPLHRYVARRLGDENADDVVAETFLIAFRQRHRYDRTRVEALPWLYGIAGNLIARHRRAESRALRAWARSGPDPATPSHADHVAARVTAAAALAGLAAKDREVLLLVTWADLSYEQVAAALDIPLGTVRSRLNRARRKVRQALDGINPMTATGKESPA
jgi:RNA polymerase sigma factor (sigma-70 family)